jgi:hypothetical protein
MDVACLTADGTLLWHCPGCRTTHGVPVVGGRRWKWNESLTAPTLAPSVKILPSLVQPLCHTFIEDGRVRFLADCSHPLAGQIVRMKYWET